LALLASPLADRANCLHPKELCIHHSVGLKHSTEVFTYHLYRLPVAPVVAPFIEPAKGSSYV
jgi:hypothetical protein